MWPFKKRDWWYFFYNDPVYTINRQNARIDINTGRLEMLDFDGWCRIKGTLKDEMPIRDKLLHEMPKWRYKQWLIAIEGKKWNYK